MPFHILYLPRYDPFFLSASETCREAGVPPDLLALPRKNCNISVNPLAFLGELRYSILALSKSEC